MAALRSLEGMTAWSREPFLKIKSLFTECQGDSMEEARLERWTDVGYAKQVWEQTGKQGAFTMAYMCTTRHLMPKDEFVCVFDKAQLSQRY